MSLVTIPRSCVIALLLAGVACAQTAPTTDPFAAARFLVGTGHGDLSCEPGTGKTVREYRFVLNNRYLEVRNKSTHPAQPKNPKGEVHEDWGMISFDRSRNKLIWRHFHVEGFVNQYAAEPVRAGVLVFQSEAIENIPVG